MGLVLLFYFLAIIIGYKTIISAQKKFSTFLNHYTLTNIYWIGILFASMFMNNYRTPVSSDVYLIFIEGLIVYNSTIIFVKKNDALITYVPIFDINRRRILEFFVLICLIPTAYVNYKLIQSGVELWQLNHEYWDYHKNGTDYWLLEFQQVLLSPLSLFIMGTSFYYVYKKYSYRDIYITIFIALIISVCYLLISGGGRSQVMIMMCVIMLSYMASRTKALKDYLYKPSSSILIVLIITGIIALGWANVGRGKSDDFFLEAINGQIIFAPLFEHYLYNTDVFTEYTLGASMFETFIGIIQFPFKLLFDYQFYTASYNNEIIRNFVYLPTYGTFYNGQVSAYWYYMRDFGYWGIVIGPIITASLYNLLYKFCRKNSFFLCFYSCSILLGCFNTTYPFGKVFWVSFAFMLILSKLLKKDGFFANKYTY